MIHVDNVTRRYGALTAVDNVSFSLEANEIVGFVGPNGAGKSTMLKMLSTFLLPSEGQIAVDGIDAVENPLAVRRPDAKRPKERKNAPSKNAPK